MRLDLDCNGSWVVNPDELARYLDVSTAYLKRQEELGFVAVRLETGTDEDSGLSRITINLPGRNWEAIFDLDGAMLSETRG